MLALPLFFCISLELTTLFLSQNELGGGGPTFCSKGSGESVVFACEFRHSYHHVNANRFNVLLVSLAGCDCLKNGHGSLPRIATTYTILKNGGQEKTLDLQLFDDFGVVDDEHQALFRNWFARFCGVREMADGDSLSTEDPSTPHFGPEGLVRPGVAWV